MDERKRLELTAVLAVRNEEANLARCLQGLQGAARVLVVDSGSTDRTAELASAAGAEVHQFHYSGRYPKKRQWALDNLSIRTPWTVVIDADEYVTPALWSELGEAMQSTPHDALTVRKQFHFLGKRFRHGGFDFRAVFAFRTGKARYEQTLAEAASGLDMEVHERVLVQGSIGALREPLVHDDFKGLQAYLTRHNQYSTWEALLRRAFLDGGAWGEEAISARLLGNAQERRRFLKQLAIRVPFEPELWFLYHYVLRLGFLEGKRGLVASSVRAQYIRNVRAKLYELDVTGK